MYKEAKYKFVTIYTKIKSAHEYLANFKASSFNLMT